MIECQQSSCLLCKWFESRSGFCRLNPPTPIALNEHNYVKIIAMWPKITSPQIDVCSHFEKITPNMID